MKIAIGSDHAGFDAKREVIDYLRNKGYDVLDCGPSSAERCDYPDFAYAVGTSVQNKEVDFGVLICSSGEGISMAANRMKGVRCGLAYNDEVAALIKQHNNANIISFGAKFMSVEDITRRIEIFKDSEFEGGRHAGRVDKIENIK